MKYVKMFEDFSEEDMDFALIKIKSKYSIDEVKKMIHDEAKEWVEILGIESTGEENDDIIKLYNKTSCFEAQEMVLDNIIEWYTKEFNKELDDDDRSDLSAKISQYYGPNIWDEHGRLII